MENNSIAIKDDYAEFIVVSPKYGVVISLIDIEDIPLIKKHKWYVRNNQGVFYIVRMKDKSTIRLHRVLTNCPKSMVVDHINRNSLDNRKYNLKITTQTENAKNRKFLTDHPNVYKRKDNGKYQAMIRINGKNTSGGCYFDIEEAKKAAKELRRKYMRGEFIYGQNM